MEADNRIVTNINCKIPEGHQAEVKIIQAEQKPRYYRIGNGIRNTFMKDHVAIDAIDELAQMTPQELWTIKLVKDNLDLIQERTTSGYSMRTSCKARILSSELTSAEKQKFKTGYKRLRKKNLLRRIKRQYYILNPDFFIPHFYVEEMTDFLKCD